MIFARTRRSSTDRLRVLPQIAGESFVRSRSTRFRAYRRHSGHARHGFASTTPIGPLTQTAFFAAPTLNRSLVVGSPPPACLGQTDSRSFSSTSWVTMCHRADPETGPLGLTRLAAISSSPDHGTDRSSPTCAIALQRGATLAGTVGEICLGRQESHVGRSRRTSTVSRGAGHIRFARPFPGCPGLS